MALPGSIGIGGVIDAKVVVIDSTSADHANPVAARGSVSQTATAFPSISLLYDCKLKMAVAVEDGDKRIPLHTCMRRMDSMMRDDCTQSEGEELEEFFSTREHDLAIFTRNMEDYTRCIKTKKYDEAVSLFTTLLESAIHKYNKRAGRDELRLWESMERAGLTKNDAFLCACGVRKLWDMAISCQTILMESRDKAVWYAEKLRSHCCDVLAVVEWLHLLVSCNDGTGEVDEEIDQCEQLYWGGLKLKYINRRRATLFVQNC